MPCAVQHPQSEIIVSKPGEADYAIAVNFVREEFHRRFKCRLTEFYPLIVSRYSGTKLTAVAGLRGAGDTKLFLEQYLGQPVEAVIGNHFPAQIDRSKIVELGGFAALDRQAALALMLAIPPLLIEQGFEKLVCTANRPIQKCLDRLGLQPVCLAEALIDEIQASPTSNWGSYYAGHPLVLAGDIQAGWRTMEQRTENSQCC